MPPLSVSPQHFLVVCAPVAGKGPCLIFHFQPALASPSRDTHLVPAWLELFSVNT